jgi:uridine kinase
MEKTGSIILQKARKHGQKPFLAAIDGRCAAGKTTLAEWLQKETGCPVIHMDHFFLRREQRSRQRLLEPGGNVDYERFLSEVMIPLSRGQEFSYRPFDCKTMELSAPVAIKPSGLSVIEGSYCCHPVLWDFYDLRVFLHVEPEEQLRRIRQRNGEEALSLFRERWIPMEETYFSAFRIRERCDLVFQEEEIQ